jgi:hypothetical protein
VSGAEEHQHKTGSFFESQDAQQSGQSLRLEEAVFEANGSPLYVLNARARVKNVGVKGYRGATVHFFCRVDPSGEWTPVGERPLPGVPPGYSVTCDLVTSSEGLPILNSKGEVIPCQYRIEVHYDGGVSTGEGEFHPSCIHEH